ncbi:MAG: metallopeptidase TldD-related protein, partial [Planctomycetota bacterium]|nr:metallopeptidase TldD-related protein [Planctomycetota bacterium]
GRYQIDTLAEAYANTHGLFAYHPSSNAVFSSTVTAPQGNGEGWATRAHHDPSKLDTDIVQSDAIRIADKTQNPQPLAPGRYTAILKPAAVSELVFFLARLGFNGQAFSENRSYLKGQLGGQHFGENVTITDNPYDPRMPGRPWDLEGSSSDRVALIDQGKASGLCWDRASAAAHGDGQKTTGHSLQQPNNTGPQARNIIFEGNPENTVHDLIAGVDNGLLIQRFHYCNVVNPTELSITGMSRSGVSQIKDGVITKPLCNFRFTISILEVLSKIDALSRAVRAEGALFGARVVAPAVRVHDFQITSTTEF